MNGYFKSLLKQSSVSIGGSNSSAPVREPAPGSVAADPVTPMHVDTVAFVGPTAGEIERFDVKTADTHRANDFEGPLTPRDPISVENDVATDAPRGILNHRMVARSDETEKTVVDQSEPAFAAQNSIRSVVPETTAEPMPGPAVSTNEVIENRTKTTAGVVRVGEFRNITGRELATESDALSETVRTLARPEFSIPPDYVEGIREWLTSAPVESDEITLDRLINQHHDNDSSALRERDGSLRPNNELDRSSPDELQEFSLSIGSISIVVEEPARQPPPPPSNLQPVERAPANTQPRARDAFALSRSYFRGF